MLELPIELKVMAVALTAAAVAALVDFIRGWTLSCDKRVADAQDDIADVAVKAYENSVARKGESDDHTPLSWERADLLQRMEDINGWQDGILNRLAELENPPVLEMVEEETRDLDAVFGDIADRIADLERRGHVDVDKLDEILADFAAQGKRLTSLETARKAMQADLKALKVRVALNALEPKGKR